jgi:hypothetical protein
MWLDDHHYGKPLPSTGSGSVIAARQLLTPSRIASHHQQRNTTSSSGRRTSTSSSLLTPVTGGGTISGMDHSTATAIAAATTATARGDRYERTFVPGVPIPPSPFVIPTALTPRRLPPPPSSSTLTDLTTSTLQWRVGGSGTSYPPLPLPSRLTTSSPLSSSHSPSRLARLTMMATPSSSSATRSSRTNGSLSARRHNQHPPSSHHSGGDRKTPSFSPSSSMFHQSHVNNGSLSARRALTASPPTMGTNVIEPPLQSVMNQPTDPALLSRWQIEEKGMMDAENNYVGQPKKSRAETLAEEKAALFAFVAHPTSGAALLPSLTDVVGTKSKWTDERIDELWYAGGGGSSTFFHIQQLLHLRKTFPSIEKLIAKVKASHGVCIRPVIVDTQITMLAHERIGMSKQREDYGMVIASQLFVMASTSCETNHNTD